MTKQVDTQKYTEFVDAVTSQESKDYISFNSRCFGIQSEESGDGLPVHRLLTAALGICAEGGEFTEVVKKNEQHNQEWSWEETPEVLAALEQLRKSEEATND